MGGIFPATLDLARLRVQLLAFTGPELRAAAEAARKAGARSLGVGREDALALFELAAAIAAQGSLDELGAFMRTGRLPEVLQLSARHMEHVRGGRLGLTVARGIAPEVLLESWIQIGAKR